MSGWAIATALLAIIAVFAACAAIAAHNTRGRG